MRNLVAFGFVVACSLVGASTGAARGASGASGQLLAAGTARGDISTTVGDSDTIGMDLDAGEKLSVKWTSGFTANVTLTDPAGAPVAIGLDGVTSGSVTALPVATAGRHTFTVTSADGTQGRYTLTARGAWDKTLVLVGTDQATFDLPMPADAVVKGKVRPLPGAANPNILSMLSPAGAELLAGPVVGSSGLAKLPAIRCVDPGVYRLDVSASSGTLQFRATLKRTVRHEAMTKLDLTNGLVGPSFESDGIGDFFGRSCAGCHDWARTFVGVRANAREAIVRMRTGNMPPSGPRPGKATLDLVGEWTRTGFGR